MRVVLLLLTAGLVGCVSDAPVPGQAAPVAEGDAWVWQRMSGGEDIGPRVERVEAVGSLPWGGIERETVTLALGFPEPRPPREGVTTIAPTGATAWRDAQGAALGRGAAYEADEDQQVERFTIWRAAPCPQYPDSFVVGQNMTVTCQQTAREWRTGGFTGMLTLGKETREFIVTAREQVVVPAGTFEAYRIEQTSRGEEGGNKYFVESTLWYAPAACGVVKRVANEYMESLQDVRCAATGMDTGIDPAVEASAVGAGFQGGDGLALPPVVARCQLRQVGAGAGGQYQDVFEADCGLLEAIRVQPSAFETIRIEVTWDVESLANAYAQVHVTASGQTASGSSQPVVLEIPAAAPAEEIVATVTVDGATTGGRFWVDFHMLGRPPF